MLNRLLILIFMLLLILLFSGCVQVDIGEEDVSEMRISDFKIWEGTPVQDLAKAVNSQNVKKIKKLVKAHPELLDYQEKNFGATLLFWAIGMEKYEAAKALLECGADPNIICTWEGGTALYRAAKYSFIDTQAKKDAKYVKLLLKYGADPNIGFVGNDHNNSDEIGTTPLMQSIGCGIEKTKALVEGGADINYRTPSGMTAAIIALRHGSINATFEAMKYAHYLIADKGAKVKEPYSIHLRNTDSMVVPMHYPVTILRDWIPPLNSEGYKMKLEIIEEFARQGVNYKETKPSKDRLDQIQKLYPDTWQEYIEKY